MCRVKVVMHVDQDVQSDVPTSLDLEVEGELVGFGDIFWEVTYSWLSEEE